MNWTKNEIYELALENIETWGSIFAPNQSDCPLCREVNNICEECSLWMLYPKPPYADCAFISHKQERLCLVVRGLKKNKPALRALARAVFLNNRQT